LSPAHNDSLLIKAKRTMTLVIVLSISIALVIIFLFEQRVQESTSSQVFDALGESAGNVENVVDVALQDYMATLNFLHSSPSVKGLVNASANDGDTALPPLSEQQWKQQVEETFTAYIENNQEIDQIRIILANEAGQEFVRVERQGNRVESISESDLQSKSSRDYFQQSISQNRKEFYISDINLNREYGEIEYPYKSTLRLSLPLFRDDGSRYGFIIANINAQYLLNKMREALFGSQRLIVTDSDGYFIVHPDEDKSYSRDLNPDLTWDVEYQMAREEGQTVVQPRAFETEHFYAVTKPFYLASKAKSIPLYLHVITYERNVNSLIQDKRLSVYGVIGILALVFSIVLWFMHRSNMDNLKLANVRRESGAIVASSKDAIFSVDDEGTIKSWNMAAETLFDLPSQLAIGHHFSSWQSLVSLNLDMVFAAPETQTTYSAQYITNKSEERYLSITASKILDGDRNMTGVAIVIRDVTDERIAKTAVEKINAELEDKVQRRTKDLVKATREAKKASEVKSAFISNISHEMRTPLNGIIGSLALLKKQALNEKSMQLLSMVDVSCNSLNTLINDVLDLSKIEAGKLDIDHQLFDPMMLIESLANIFAVKAQSKGLEFLVDFTELSDLKAYSDPHRINQILSNLLHNAIKFTEQGHILLRVGAHQGPNGERQLQFSVSDTGVGIAPEYQAKLFTPFTQADAKVSVQYGGTGLGLSICKQLTKLLGGDIRLHSSEGRGSVFSFYVSYSASSVDNRLNEDMATETSSYFNDLKWGVLAPYKPLEDHLCGLLRHAGGSAMPVEDAIDEPLDKWPQFDALLIDVSSPFIQSLDAIWHHAKERGVAATMPKVYVLQHIDASSIDFTDVTVRYLTKPLLKSTLAGLEHQTLPAKALNNNEIENAEPSDVSLNIKQLPSATKDTSKAGREIENANVLVVDDNLINREVAKGVLEGLPINVYTCNDGQEVVAFLSKCEEKQQHVHTILMDCQMPVMDGYETTKAIRDGKAGRTHIDVPIIAMTASAMRGEREKCLEAGMDDFSTKPVMAEVLIPKVKHWLVEQMKKSGYKTDNVSPLVDKLMHSISEEVQSISATPPHERYWDKENAIARIKGDKALFSRVCSLFAHSAPDKVKLLEKAIAHRDVDQAKTLTLKLKGMSSDIGAVQLQNDFEKLWECVSYEQWQDALNHLPTIQQDLITFLKIMDVA